MLFKYNGERNYLDKRVCIAGHYLVNTYITPSDIYSYIRRAKQSEGTTLMNSHNPMVLSALCVCR